MSAQQQRKIKQRACRAAGQYVYGFFHFKRVADMAAQGLFHACDQGCDMASCLLADIHHGGGKLQCLIQGFHQGAIAHFDIQHNPLSTHGQLL